MRRCDQIDINSSEIPDALLRTSFPSHIPEQTRRASSPRSSHWIPRQLRRDWLCFLVLLNVVVLSLLLVCAIGRSSALSYNTSSCEIYNGTSVCPSSAPPGPSYTVFQGWSPGTYFVGAYLPVMIATIMAILWKCVFQRIKEIEPCYQLSRSNGAEARDSLLFRCTKDYLGIAPGSFDGEHPLLFIGSVNSLVLTITTALAPGVLYIAVDEDKCSVNLGPKTASNDCRPTLENDKTLAYILCALAFVSLGLTSTLFKIMRKRPLNLRMEAFSISGIASLFHFGAGSGPDVMSMQRFPDHRYALRNFRDEKPLFKVLKIDGDTGKEDPKTIQRPKEPVRGLKMIFAIVFSLYLIGILILILFYRFTEPGPNNGFEAFMDSTVVYPLQAIPGISKYPLKAMAGSVNILFPYKSRYKHKQ